MKITLSKYIVKPLISGALMAVVAYAVYKLSMLVLNISAFLDNLISMLLALFISGTAYCLMIFALKIMDKNEVEMLPSGKSIYRLLVKLGIYKG